MDNNDMYELDERLQKWRLAAHYATTITEPLLTLTVRVQYEDDFARAYRVDPPWARMVLAGVLSDLVRTLATKDPWRAMSARYGAWTVGPNPPVRNTAVLRDGRTKLTDWRIQTDLLGQPMHGTDVDPSYAPLHARRIAVGTAVVLAGGAHGWGSAATATTLMGERAGLDAATEAITWALHRRRCYGVPADDSFVRLSFSRWSNIAYDYEVLGRPLDLTEHELWVFDQRLPWILDEHPPMD